MRTLGGLSYGVYLWHMPVLEALKLHGAFPKRAAEALPAVLGPTLVLAALSWWLVGRPVLRRVARGGRRERVVRPRTRVGVPAAAPATSGSVRRFCAEVVADRRSWPGRSEGDVPLAT